MSLGVIGREPIRIDHGCAFRALSNIAAERQCLAEDQPTLTREAAADPSAPVDLNVDPGIAPPGGETVRQAKTGRGRAAAPKLNPSTLPCSRSPMMFGVISS